jgi:xanthosine utilization system XapX-like protein
MVQGALAGSLAGSAGTVVLNMTTYADMAIRGRTTRSAPSALVGTVAEKIGLPLSSHKNTLPDQTLQNRKSGIGVLLGYANGLSVGALYGLLRLHLEDVPLPLAGLLVGTTAMMASDIPLVALGISHPKTWGVSGWVADIIPHLFYGLATVLSYEALTNRN